MENQKQIINIYPIHVQNIKFINEWSQKKSQSKNFESIVNFMIQNQSCKVWAQKKFKPQNFSKPNR